jgi:hypothetical protein
MKGNFHCELYRIGNLNSVKALALGTDIHSIALAIVLVRLGLVYIGLICPGLARLTVITFRCISCVRGGARVAWQSDPDRRGACRHLLDLDVIHDSEFSPVLGNQDCLPRAVLPVQPEWRIVAIA